MRAVVPTALGETASPPAIVALLSQVFSDCALFLLAAVLPCLMVLSDRSAAAVLTTAALIASLGALLGRGPADMLRRFRTTLSLPEAGVGAALYGWALLSTLWSGHQGETLSELGVVTLLLAGTLTLRVALADRVPGAWLLPAMTIALMVTMAGIAVETVYDFPIGRLLGIHHSPGVFARPTLTLLLMLWPLAALLRQNGQNLLALVMCMLSVITVTTAHSGAALFALLFSVLAYLAARFRPRIAIRVGTASILLGILVAPWIGDIGTRVLPSPFLKVVQSIPGHSLDARDRLGIWRMFGDVARRNLLLGGGFGSSRWLSEKVSGAGVREHGTGNPLHPHNSFLQIWVELGAVGALLFGGLVLATARHLTRMPPDRLASRFTWLACVAVIATVSHGAWQSWWIAAIGSALIVFQVSAASANAEVFDGQGAFFPLHRWPWRAVLLRGVAVVHDFLMAGAALQIALLLRLGLKRTLEGLPHYWWPTVLFMASVAAVGPLLRLNSGIWKYASLPDLRAIVETSSVATILLVIAKLFVPGLESVPRSVPLGTWFVTIVLLSGPRIAYRMWKTTYRMDRVEGTSRHPVVLIGAGDEADRFLRTISEQRSNRYDVIAVVDERGRRTGRAIRGVPVIGQVDNIEEVLTQLELRGRRPESFIITKSREAFGAAMTDHLVSVAQQHDITVLRLPGRPELGAVAHGAIKLEPIVIDDLLYRKVARLDLDGIHDLVRGRRILVTGAGGSIGSELCRQLAALEPAALCLLDVSEYLLYMIDTELRERHPDLPIDALIANVRERDQIMRIFGRAKPQLVFHAAALKHVPMVELQPLEGLLTNTIGTRNVADASIAIEAEVVVLISTDKAINPSSVMGASKRMAELYCQALDIEQATRFVTVRFGNVLGSAGSVVPLFQRQIAAGGPVTVTHPDINRYFLTIPESVQLVLQATNHGVNAANRGAIYVLDMGQPVKIADLARKMIRLAGLRVDEDIRIVYTGLRPGEKLFEELFDPDEPPMETEAAGVLVATPRTAALELICAAYDRLAELSQRSCSCEALQLLTDNIPEYVPDPLLVERFGLVRSIVPPLLETSEAAPRAVL